MKEISRKSVTERLAAENLWWDDPGNILYKEYQPRPYIDLFYPLATKLGIKRAVVLMGPRRVGKTVLIHHVIQRMIQNGWDSKHICYISIDHPLYNGLSLDDVLELFKEASGIDYMSEECTIFFDEIQYSKDWERYLKVIVDKFPKLKCIVSGSAAAALKRQSTESGAGRFTDFLLPPLTFYEYLILLGDNEFAGMGGDAFKQLDRKKLGILNEKFINYINFGGYPEVLLHREIQRDPGRFIKSDIIDKVLLRDLPLLYGIQDIQELNSLFTTLAYNSANEVSLNELARNSGIAKNTIKKYISYLEAAFLLKRVYRVNKNSKKFKRENYFKVYLTNPSIRAAMFSPITKDDQAMGDMVETAIFSQWFHDASPLYYARWDNGEVDIVSLKFNDQEAFWAVEVKWTDRFFDNPTQLKSLLSFCRKNGLENSLVTTINKSGSKFLDNHEIRFVPASRYCLTLGYNIIKKQ